MAPRPASAKPSARLAFGAGLVLLSALLFSFKGVLVKLAYAEGAGTIALLYLRFAMALPLFWALMIARNGLLASVRLTRADLALAMAGGGAAMYIAWVADFIALRLIDVGLERIILFSFPAFVLLFDAIRLKRWPPLRHLAVLALVETGVVLAAGGHGRGSVFANLEGAAWALLAALMFAVFIMINQKSSRAIGPVRFSTLASTGAFVALTIHFFGFEPLASLGFTAKGYLYTALIALFSTFVPYLLFAEGIQRTGASRAALLSGVAPAAAVLYGLFFLGETMSGLQLAGGAIVVGGVVLLEARIRRKPAETRPI